MPEYCQKGAGTVRRSWRAPAGGRLFRSSRLAVVLAAALLLTAGCGSSAAGGGTAPARHGPEITIMTRSISGVGTVLVTEKGYALYMFAPDNHRTVTCTGACAGTWPPLMLPSGGTLAAGPGVNAALLGSDPDPAGGRVVTYDGWPLYTYTGDVAPAQATGQGIDLNGGEWYVLRPSGTPLIPQP
jgi:predicted lipoprotein with Yx(FWY)xxD motif